MTWGLSGLHRPQPGKAIFFEQSLKFFGQKTAAKNEK